MAEEAPGGCSGTAGGVRGVATDDKERKTALSSELFMARRGQELSRECGQVLLSTGLAVR